MTRRYLYLLLPHFVLLLSGCQHLWRQPAQQFPVAFPTPPATKEQVIGVINANSSRIQQLESNVSLRVRGFGLSGKLAMERPRRLRLQTSLFGIQGIGVDLGSNDELFWIFSEQMRPPGVYYARHDQFARSSARQLVPVEPDWIIQALGVVELDPSGHHEGPFERVPGRLEIHSQLASAAGPVKKITVVDSVHGLVQEQHIYDVQGNIVASARASKHQFYPEAGVTLPRHIEVQFAPGQPNQTAFQIDVANYRINQLAGDPARLWSMPQPEGYPLVDLADPRSLDMLGAPPDFAGTQGHSPMRDARSSFRPRFRQARR